MVKNVNSMDPKNPENIAFFKMFLKWASLALLVIILISALFQTFYIVPAGDRGVLLTFGKASLQARPEGLGIKIPFVQKVYKMEVRTQKYEAGASAASKDLQIVSASIATNYHLLPEEVPRLYVELGPNYADRVIQPLEQEVVKATTAKFTAEELITKREEVRLEIKNVLAERLLPRGIIVEELSITNFDFSTSFNAAIESKVTAEQLKLKAERDLERIKVEAEQVQASAIGRKEAIIAEAEGQAEAIRVIQQELSRSPQYVDYLKVQRWDGKLPQVTGGAVPFISIDK